MSKMNITLVAAAMTILCGSAQAQTPVSPPAPAPAEWTTLVITADIAKPADVAWERIGGNDWCGIAKYLDIQSCAIASGKGEVGSIRTINGTIMEIVVARTAHSYTYAQPLGNNFYHGTMAVESVDATHSRLVYTMLWNAAPLGTAQAKADARETRRSRFQIAVNKMAAAANAP
jgi:hypothetical protein